MFSWTTVGVLILAASAELAFAGSQSEAPAATPNATRASQEPSQDGSGSGFFLLQVVNIKTGNGVVGELPGTKVSVVKEKGAEVTVRDSGQHIFTFKRSLLTSDAVLAEKLANADADRQDQIQIQLDEQRRRLAKPAPSAVAQSQVQPQSSVTSGQIQPPPPGSILLDRKKPDESQGQRPPVTGTTLLDQKGPGEHPLDRGAYDATDKKLHRDRHGHQYWIDIWGRAHYVN
jgi:hypothetical protein